MTSRSLTRRIEECDVGTLAAAIGVQFVEHQESETRTVANDLAINVLLTGHQELEHHEVRQQDVRRIVGDPTTFLGVLLSCIARERDGLLALLRST